jgi:hypothetical protein
MLNAMNKFIEFLANVFALVAIIFILSGLCFAIIFVIVNRDLFLTI